MTGKHKHKLNSSTKSVKTRKYLDAVGRVRLTSHSFVLFPVLFVSFTFGLNWRQLVSRVETPVSSGSYISVSDQCQFLQQIQMTVPSPQLRQSLGIVRGTRMPIGVDTCLDRLASHWKPSCKTLYPLRFESKIRKFFPTFCQIASRRAELVHRIHRRVSKNKQILTCCWVRGFVLTS